jgi:hypothetical protein
MLITNSLNGSVIYQKIFPEDQERRIKVRGTLKKTQTITAEGPEFTHYNRDYPSGEIYVLLP